MLHLMKIFLGLCISAILSGCPFLATLFGYTAFEGYEMMRSGDTVEPNIVVERQIGFATLSGTYDIQKADTNANLTLSTDDFCITYGNYAGYTGSDGKFVPETVISVQGAGMDVARTYQGTWGTFHAGSLLGGKNTTDYKGYFVSEILGLNPANFVKQSDGQAQGGVVYEYYSCKDPALGLDYMLKLFYSSDRSGAIYLYGVRDYTVSTAPLIDNFEFVDFQPDKSFALSEAIANYDGSGSGTSSLFNVEAYEGEWDSGYVEIDGVSYNLHATNLRALESAGVMPFEDKYMELGYDTPTKSGGRKDVAFLFGRRVLILKLELASGDDKVLRDAKVYGFSTEITNNAVTDEELVHGSYGIHPSGQVVDEQTFIDTYFGDAPYTVTKQGETHYYTSTGREITREEYQILLSGGTIDEPSEEVSEETSGDVSENTAEENDEETAETEDSGDTTETAEDTGDPETTEVAEDTGDAETTEVAEDEESSVSENTPADGGSGFAGVGTDTSEKEPEQDITVGDWFVIGGLHSDVTLASLELYLKTYATSYQTMGSGNAVTYTVTRGSAKMIFVLEKNTTISSMEVFYENG